MGLISGIRRFPTFLKEVHSELKKVSWSTRRELTAATVVVLIGALFLLLYIFIIDSTLTFLMSFII